MGNEIIDRKIFSEVKKELSNAEKAAKDDDDILKSIIGEFGNFQFLNLFLIGISGIMIGWNNFVTKFLSHEVDFWCTRVRFH